jgi:glycosyltransferase involved in cell wall biosynthesis
MTLGRMDSRERAKGFDELIELMPRLKSERRDIALLLAGEGDDRPRLQVKVRELGLQNDVVFTGFVPESLKADYFRLADAFAMASTWEGFGIVLLEALACGVPVVGSTLDGTREALLEGRLGAVVDPGDPAALATAILSAVNRIKVVPPGLERYTFPYFIERWQSVVQQIAAKGPASRAQVNLSPNSAAL